MEQIEKEKLYISVLSHWGFENQLKMVHEEIGELLQAINKLDRLTLPDEGFGTQPKKHHSIKYCLAYWSLCSEIADLTIMMDQMKMVFNGEAVQLSEDRKLERLKDRFNNYLIKNGRHEETI